MYAATSERILLIGENHLCISLENVLVSNLRESDILKIIDWEEWRSLINKVDDDSIVSLGKFDKIVICNLPSEANSVDRCEDINNLMSPKSSESIKINLIYTLVDKLGDLSPQIMFGLLMNGEGAGSVDSLDESLISGLIPSLQQEYPKIEFVTVTIRDKNIFGKSIMNELKIWDGELEVAYKTEERLVKRYNVISSIRKITENTDLVLRRGVYIITGGLGGLGLATARLLTEMGEASDIILVSRSGKIPYEGQGLESTLAWLQNESGVNIIILIEIVIKINKRYSELSNLYISNDYFP
jgi:hypothetical protein